MLTGPDQVVAAHIRENYQKAQTGLVDGKGNVDEEATSSYQDAMVNTIQYGAPVVAEDVLFGSDKTLEGNDAVGQAAIKATFGDKIVPESEKGLQNIKAETAPVVKNSDGQIISGGGRTITATYETPVYDKSGAVQKVVENGVEKNKTTTHQMDYHGRRGLFSDGPERAVEDAGCPVRGWWNLLVVVQRFHVMMTK